MKANRVTISLDDNSKKILDENSSKYNVSKSDIIGYLINYAKYPKYSKAEIDEQHQTNIELERFNTKLNKIQLDYHGECNLLDQIVHILNCLRKYPGNDADYWISTLQNLLKRSREGSDTVLQRSKELRNEVNNHGVR